MLIKILEISNENINENNHLNRNITVISFFYIRPCQAL
jgi:hypothetical protein